MQNFHRILKLEDRGYLHFSFNAIIVPRKQKYQVSVMTRGPQKLNFEMEQKPGGWKIVTAPLPPRWILKLEKTLEKFILEQNTQNFNRHSLPFILINKTIELTKKAG